MDIWSYNFTTGTFKPVTDYVGKNAYPMWIGNKMYFVSDRDNGISNLYVQDLATNAVTRLTNYDDFDVMMPSTDGASIVFLYNGYVHTMDVATGTVTRRHIMIPTDGWASRTRIIDAREYLHAADASPDGKSLLLEARGDLFSVNVEKKTLRQSLVLTRHARDASGPLARRKDRCVLLRQHGQLSALSPTGHWRSPYPDHDHTGPDGLPYRLVA